MKDESKPFADNRGYATVELTLIMPLLVLMIVMIVGLFIDSINDAFSRAESYEYLYTYNKRNEENSGAEEKQYSFAHTVLGNGNTDAAVSTTGGEIAVSLYHIERKVNGSYSAGSSAEYKTEYDKTTGRLRRWQLYGDYLRE